MEIVRNINNKRVCDISSDRRMVRIVRGDCETIVIANPDGTLSIFHRLIPAG